MEGQNLGQFPAFVPAVSLLQVTGQPVGIRVSYGNEAERETLLRRMAGQILSKTGLAPSAGPGLFLLEIRLDCGTGALFKTLADVPRESLPCPCGCGGWIIRYVDLSQQYQAALDSVSIAGVVPAECGYPHSQQA
jgi:hypothetical protein